MGKIPDALRETIARNIRDCRLRKYPGRGGGKKCAELFGVSPQQWSPWESGKRTPDELRLAQIADFFGVTVEYMRRDNGVPRQEPPPSRQPPPHSDPFIAPQNFTTLDQAGTPAGFFWLLRHLICYAMPDGICIRLEDGSAIRISHEPAPRRE